MDSNVPMYAAGGPHENKQPSLEFLRRVRVGELQAVTSTEVLQEVLHRYHRLGRPDIAERVYDLVVPLCADVLPVTIADTDACVHLLGEVDGSVRGALHVAVMRNNDLETIATLDAGFDAFGVQRYSLG